MEELTEDEQFARAIQLSMEGGESVRANILFILFSILRFLNRIYLSKRFIIIFREFKIKNL